jgi:hypothetical protein
MKICIRDASWFGVRRLVKLGSHSSVSPQERPDRAALNQDIVFF